MDFFEVCKEATTRYGPAAPHEEQISMFTDASFWNACVALCGSKTSSESILNLMWSLRDLPRFVPVGKAYWRWEHYLICA